eukprot:327810_1
MDDLKYEALMKPSWTSNEFKDEDLTRLKVKGNKCFKVTDYESALANYLTILHRTMHANQNSCLKLDAYNNIALIYFKIQQYHNCIDKCNIALKINCKHPKALYRLKQCLSILKKSKLPNNQANKYTLTNSATCNKMGIVSSQLYEIRRIPFNQCKIGLFATKFIKQGTIILKEREMFKLPQNAQSSICYDKNGGVKRIDENEESIKHIYNNVFSKQQKQIFSSMRCSDIDLKNNKLWNIFLTNNIVIGEYQAIFPTASRLTHCCLPNTNGYYNEKTNKYNLITACDIKKGEEITTTFLGMIPMIREDRRNELLKLYGFICECKCCNYETYKEYEESIAEFVRLRQKLLDSMMNPETLCKSNPYNIIDKILNILKTYYNSHLHFMDFYTQQAVMCGHIKNDVKNMVKYAAQHTYWNNLKNGYIIDSGNKQYEYKFVMPQFYIDKPFPSAVRDVIQMVIKTKKIPKQYL